MARRRRPEAEPLDYEPPAWLWRFRRSDWDRPRTVEEIVAARLKWRGAREEWLRERGLVLWGVPGVSWDEFKRIKREEPHRVLRRRDAGP
ncbi:hypothetical protein ADK77_44140 [Streptomyces antibioticus]|nr:hypothetical protein [Streptomyces antibioticus]KOG58426.1 hypothetical protein ADK77_44140 [Streptomyces antibioticus]